MVRNSHINILAIDDDSVVRFINKTIVESLLKADVTYNEAVSGINAIQILTDMIENGEGCPDVILLDLNMPVMNGFEFIEKFQTLILADCKTEIVIVTSSDNAADKKRSFDLGVKKIVIKPMTIEKLEYAIS